MREERKVSLIFLPLLPTFNGEESLTELEKNRNKNPKMREKIKKPAGITYRNNPNGHLRVVRANLDLLRKLYEVRLKKGWDPDLKKPLTGWGIVLEMDYFQYPEKYENELMHTCWACGYDDDRYPRTLAHIIGCYEGGDDLPENYFLLCDYCHEEQPDRATRKPQIKWLENREHFYDRRNRQTEEMSESIRQECGGDQELLNAFTRFGIRTNLISESWEHSRILTGSIVKMSALAYKFIITGCQLWVRHVRKTGKIPNQIEEKKKVELWFSRVGTEKGKLPQPIIEGEDEENLLKELWKQGKKLLLEIKKVPASS